MDIDLHKIRREYTKNQLSVDNCHGNPLEQLSIWLKDAIKCKIEDSTAMSISTITIDNRPSSRIVLLKSVSEDGLIFFTNYNSRKGKELNINPYISVNFFWSLLERQIRVEGKVVKLPKQLSDKYFESRPYSSKIGVWASKQSDILENKEILLKKFNDFSARFQSKVPRPDFWGGYKILPDYFEFWQGGSNRLHDRIVYKLIGNNTWNTFRLYP